MVRKRRRQSISRPIHLFVLHCVLAKKRLFLYASLLLLAVCLSFLDDKGGKEKVNYLKNVEKERKCKQCTMQLPLVFFSQKSLPLLDDHVNIFVNVLCNIEKT
jgi:hypothetical protein